MDNFKNYFDDYQNEQGSDILPGTEYNNGHQTDTDAPDSGRSVPDNASSNFLSYVMEIRRQAIALQNGKLSGLFPGSLLCISLMALPALVLYIFGFYFTSYNPTAGRAIEIVSLMIPLFFTGPLAAGYIYGIMGGIRAGQFDMKTLFFALNDRYLGKTEASFLITAAASFAPLLPAIILSSFSGNLACSGAGFAFIATKVLCVLLYTVGAAAAIHILLRLSLTFPLMIDNPDIKAIEAVKLSISAMKGNCLHLFLLIISFAGWYLLAFAISFIVLLILGFTGFIYIQSADSLPQACIYLIYGVLLLYVAACISGIIAVASIIARPAIAFAVFYENMHVEIPEL